MSATGTSGKMRKLEKSVEIAAPVEAIWKALTDAEELARWFPLAAKVEPGRGGKIFLSWGPAMEGTAEIQVWEPNRRLQTTQDWGGAPFTIDWQIETRGGKNYLRLVQSGFATGADWEKEVWDSTDYGWAFMLTNLRHYLERHAAQPRLVAWPRRKVAKPREEIYARLAGKPGLFSEGAQETLRAGERYSLRTATGESWSGRVEFVVAPWGFCVTVDSLNDALAWLTIEGGGSEHEAQLWFSTYGVAKTEVDALGQRWQQALERILV